MSEEMRYDDIKEGNREVEGDIFKEMMELKKKQIRKIYEPNLLK